MEQVFFNVPLSKLEPIFKRWMKEAQIEMQPEVTSILEDLQNSQKTEYLSKRDVSKLFGISLSTVNIWIDKKILKTYGFPNSRLVFFKLSEVEETLMQVNE